MYLKKRFKPSKTMPLDIGIIHLVGIGGIGMSGIAEILHNLGYHVTGSDISENTNIIRLRKKGIKIFTGHDGENVKHASVVVKSSAVPLTNPEIVAAREQQIPVVKRSEMLAELTRLKTTIAVAGSHGKTTTTSLICKMLESAKLDPTVINGGIINAYGTNAHLGSSDWLVAEADESDGTFIKIPATVGVITNIDPEHLDYWGSYDALRKAFRSFVENLPFYGFAVLCYDNEDVRSLSKAINDRRIITYSVERDDAMIIATNIRQDVSGSVFDVEIPERIMYHRDTNEQLVIKNISLSIPGIHNIQNALAAIAVAAELKISDKIIASAFENFSGVKRRFTKVAEVRGITIIDDYAHHPTEIRATSAAAKAASKGKVIAVMQPHRYSRLENLFVEFCNCFDGIDKVLVSDVYAAGEMPIKGVDRDAFVKALKDNNIDAEGFSNQKELFNIVNNIATSGDLVIFLGAGTVTQWAYDLAKRL